MTDWIPAWVKMVAAWIGSGGLLVLAGFFVRFAWKHRALIASAARGFLRENTQSDPRHGNGTVHSRLENLHAAMTQQHTTLNLVLVDHGKQIEEAMSIGTANAASLLALHKRVDIMARSFVPHLKAPDPVVPALREMIVERPHAQPPNRELGRLQDRAAAPSVEESEE